MSVLTELKSLAAGNSELAATALAERALAQPAPVRWITTLAGDYEAAGWARYVAMAIVRRGTPAQRGRNKT